MKKRAVGIFFLIIIFSLAAILSADLTLQPLKEALYYQKLDNKDVQCLLCPRRCVIKNGQRGFCQVRENQEGVLFSLVYGRPCSLHIDPIEKKPLFHFLPGSRAFSIATAGCNLRCKFCQNWQISQVRPEDIEYVSLSPEDLVNEVQKSNCPVIAYTYSEPTIFYEYMLETARLARQRGIKNVMHSSGFINEEPLRQLCKYLDAANIDLKGFSEDFYSEYTLGKLEDVLRSLKIIHQEGVHLEITNLILPGINDSPELIRKMCIWIKDNLGKDIPLHFSRFFPMHKMKYLSPTPVTTLEKARQIALSVGLEYVYIGNVPGNPAENTYCPFCKKAVIKRQGYFILENHIKDGKCEFCGNEIKGVWQ